MTARPRLSSEALDVLRLAAPIAFTQIGMVLYGTVDMLFVGRLGPGAIAGVGLGSITYFTVFVVGMGTVMGIDSHSAKAFGAGRLDLCGQLLVHTLALALGVAVPLFFLYGLAETAYRLIGVAPEVIPGALEFLRVLRWAIFPGLLFVACRQFLQSISVTRPLVLAIVAGNAVNALLDGALVLGWFGVPALGMRGCAMATLSANVVMLSIVFAAARRRLLEDGFRFHGWRGRLFADVFSLGLPAGLMMLAEVAIFACVTGFVGRFGAQTLAAHQLVLNLVSITFMIPMGLAHATAALTGQALGRGDGAAAAALGRAGTLMAMAFMTMTGLAFAGAPALLLGAFGAGAEVVSIGRPLLYCAAAFQVFDGAQAVLSGALRGMGETRRPLCFNLLGHWAIGLPVGLWLGLHRGLGATGFWLGLALGLAVVAVLLWFEWARRSADSQAAASPSSPSAPRRSPGRRPPPTRSARS